MSRSVRASTPADAPAIKALFAATGLQPNADSRSLQWKYWQQRSDWSAPRSFVLTAGEGIVAHGAIVPGAFLFGEERITTVEVTARDPCSPLQERSHSRYEVRGRELLRGLVGVGAHLLRPAAAREGPQGGGHRLGVRVKGRPRVPVLPAVDRIFPRSAWAGRPVSRPGTRRS